MNYVADNFQNEDVVASFCCLLSNTTQCTKNSVTLLRQSCKASKQSPIDSLLSGLNGESSDLICSKYKAPGICEKEFGPQLKKLAEVADKNKKPFKDVPIGKYIVN